MSLIKRIQAWDSRKRTEANRALVADFSVDAAERYVTWYDHGFFRRYWSNLHQIAPGVYRSNYPNGRRFPKLAELGMKTILNLRGGAGSVRSSSGFFTAAGPGWCCARSANRRRRRIPSVTR